MYIKLLNALIDFSNNSVRFDDSVIPDIPDDPIIPDTPEDEEVPSKYVNFVLSHSRDTLSADQRDVTAKYLYKLDKSGLLGKIRQLFIPCIAPNWDTCFLNVARYFNEDKIEIITPTGVSNSTLGQCFQICDYGIYRTSDEIKWGDCITYNWSDEDVTFDNWHILAFKPAHMDASTNVGNGGLNLRGSKGTTAVSFGIGASPSTTQRMRGQWASGTVKIDGTNVNIKDALFTFDAGWGNGTHDPYCVGLSIKDSKLLTPSSDYQEFAYNNRNLVNIINEMPLTGQYELPTTAMTGQYSWGGYCGATISTQESLATSIVSIGLGLSKTEIETYMEYTNEFMTALDIVNNNWNPDSLN